MAFHFWPRQPQALAIVRQFIVAGSASLSFAAAGLASAWPSPTLPKIQANKAPVHLSVAEMSKMVSIFYVGILISCIPSSYLANKFGRRKILLYSGILSILSWLTILFASSAVHLYVARFLAGLQLGTITTVHSIYIEEISLPDIRGSLSIFTQFMVSAGALLMFVVGPYVYYYDLVLISLLFPLLFNLTFVAMPESPYFYMMKEKPDCARQALFWLRGGLNNIELDMELKQIESFVKKEIQGRNSFSEVFVMEAPRKVIITSTVFTMMKILSGTESIKVFASTTLPEKTFGVLDPSECVIILGMANLLTSLLSICVIEKFTQKLLLFVSYIGCGLSMLTVSVWFFLNEYTSVNMQKTKCLPFLMFFIHVVFYSLACDHLTDSSKSQYSSTYIKTNSCAISNIIYGVVGFLINRFYLEWEGAYLNFLIFSVSCFLTVVFIIYNVPEAREKTLEEVEDMARQAEDNVITLPESSPKF